MPKLFLLDMDGTMIDSNGIWKDVDIRFLARRGMEYSKAYYEGVAHTIFPPAAQFTKEFCSLEESCEEIMQANELSTEEIPGHKMLLIPGVR
mgnify:CR=1 FL=1